MPIRSAAGVILKFLNYISFTVFGRRKPDFLLERGAEIITVFKPGLFGDFRKRQGGVHKKLLGVFYSDVDKVSHGKYSGGFAELKDQTRWGYPEFGGNFLHVQLFRIIFLKILQNIGNQRVVDIVTAVKQVIAFIVILKQYVAKKMTHIPILIGVRDL